MKRPIDWWLAGILAIPALIKTAFLSRPFFPWWDYGVYLGMGKYIFSLGQSGLFEPIRPPLWAIINGAIWWLGLPAIPVARVLEILISAGAAYVLYLIGKDLFGRRQGLAAAALFSGSSIFFFMGMRLYSEIPAIFFVLFSFLMVLRGRWLLGGVSLGLAILTRFPSGIFLLAFIPLLWGARKLSLFSAGLSMPIVPYLIANVFAYGNPFFSVIEAQRVISQVMSCNVLWQNPWYFYFLRVFSDNVFFIFVIPGSVLLIFAALRSKDPRAAALLLSLSLPLLYLTSLDCRIYRYLIMAIPFISLLSGYGIVHLSGKSKAWIWILALIFTVSLIQATAYYLENDLYEENPASLGYYSFQPGEGDIWSANPLVVLHTDRKILKAYYPVYDSDSAREFRERLEKDGDIGAVYLDNCGGGIICPDEACREELDLTIDLLDSASEKLYDEAWGRCWYKVYGGPLP